MKDSIVIIGAGIAGLSIGWKLALENFQVYLIDEFKAGSQCSQAGAGMIAPINEVQFGEEKLIENYIRSHSLYPDFIEKLEKSSGIKTDFQKCGTLMIAVDEDDVSEMNRLIDFQKQCGFKVDFLSNKKALELEPILTGNFKLVAKAFDEYAVDNRLVIKALKKAFIKSGGSLIENRKVESLEIKNNKIESVKISGEDLKTNRVIIATGAKLNFENLGDELKLNLRPVKGQALEFKQKNQPYLKHMIRTYHRYPIYISPRTSGHLIIGALSEEKGFDNRVTGNALLDLTYGTFKVIPQIDDMEFIEARVGFRPVLRDNNPLVGPSKIEGIFWAMGLSRHGFLLAPWIAERILEVVK